MIFKYFIILILAAAGVDSIDSYQNENGAMCTKDIEKTRMEYGKVVKYTEPISRCCDGLLKVNEECRPYCENCECMKPNVCQCIPLYEWNEATLNCEPMCDCKNGFCLRPYQCSCLDGYEKTGKEYKVCHPICKPGCPKFSNCAQPQKCECYMGYEMNTDTNECEAMCNEDTSVFDNIINKCVLNNCSCASTSGGYCLDAYDKCICYDGYRKVDAYICEPTCEPKCEKAKCVGPNQCECWPGFHATQDSNVCESNDLCRKQPCLNGECLQTGECKCKKGFRKSFSFTGQVLCETVTTFIGKIMSIILGVPIVLAGLVIFVVYIRAKRKTSNNGNNNNVRVNYHGEAENDDVGVRVGNYAD